MKKLLVFSLLTLLSFGTRAQSNQPYEFSEYKRLAATPVKSQDQTGTCWAFSTASFLESEVLRLGKGELNLSEMFVVRNIYRLKCENYVRRQGTAQFGEGGLAHDMLYAVQRYGIVPEGIYPGRKDPSKPFNHSEIDKALLEKCKEFVEQGKKGKLDPNWLTQIDEMLDNQFGKAPLNFEIDKANYTPLSFAASLGLKLDDYVTITSFSHHPFWEKFILEIPDNWSNGTFYNLPLNDLMLCATNALEKGYTLEWDADVSNMGFSSKVGLAIAPEIRWEDKSASARETAFKMWEPEHKITQEYRQELFDKQETSDDHLMHIVGMVTEKNSGLYYVVKNSWGSNAGMQGFMNVSDAYMRLNTISFTLPKSAIPQNIRKRLGLEADNAVIEKTNGARPANPNLKTTEGVKIQQAPKQQKRIPIGSKE
jgi:bleomycin hydrolase